MGFVYILAHERIPGLVKIGFTDVGVEERASQINSATGVPGGYRVAASYEVEDARGVEKRIHEALAHVRFITNKEFFETSIRHAKEVAEAVINERRLAPRLVSVPKSVVRVVQPIHVGEAIRRARKDKDLTQKQLAEMAGCGTRVVVEIENGKERAEIGIVLRLMSVLDIDLMVDTEKG